MNVVSEKDQKPCTIADVSYSAVFRACLREMKIPNYKIKYALGNGLLGGMFQTLEHYGFPLNDKTFSIFYDAVSSKLSGSSEIEYEWTEDEYEAMMNIKKWHCS
jgi:hypothetical protein